jgi:hypothetical protein
MALKLQQREERTEAIWINMAADGDGLMWWTDEDAAAGVVTREPEARVKVAPFLCPKHRSTLDRFQRQNRRFRRVDGSYPEEIDKRINFEAAARALIEDWEGVEVNGSGPKEYRPALGLQALQTDRAFEAAVTQAALYLRQAKDEALKEDEDALGNDSGGSSNTDPAPKSSTGKGSSSRKTTGG